MTGHPPTIVMAGSLPITAPWNGADKVLARTIVRSDPLHRYILQTGPDDVWPEHVVAVRERAPADLPTRASELRAGLFVARNTHRADLLHVVASVRHSPSGSARLVRAWSRLSARPIVHTLPGVAGAVHPRDLVGDVTVVFSEHTRALLEAAGVSNVVHLFPPIELPRPVDERRRELTRQRLALGPVPVLYAGHLDAGSGMDHAIESLAALPRELDRVTLVLAPRWRTNQDPGPELGRLEALAASLGLAARVRVVTGIADMAALIAACAATVLVPSSLRGKMDLPMVLLESLALGRPIVVTDRPPIREALLGGGLEVAYGDVEALAAALTSILADERHRTELAEQGRHAVLRLADPARAAAAYGSIYERLLGVPASGAETANDA